MLFILFRIEVWTSGLINRFGQRPILAVIASAILFLSFPALLGTQESQSAAAVAATFELGTIKPSKPDAQGSTFRVRGHRFATTNTSLSDLISFAYGIHATQIIGAPAWVAADKYDLTAQSSIVGQSSEVLWRGMLQKYLVECFKLKFHRDTQGLPLYVLTVGRTGPRLTKSKEDPNGIPALSVTLGARSPANANLGAVAATNANMGDFARVMQRLVLEWPVADRTGIAGRYDFALNWTPDGSQFGDIRGKIPAPTDSANAPPDLFTALQEQIGLKLDLIYAPSAILVIDRVEPPSDN